MDRKGDRNIKKLVLKNRALCKTQWLCSPVNDSVGVNQGGNASGFMFRRYMADLHEFMVYEHAVCAGD